MSEPIVVIERLNAAARNLQVPVIGRKGVLGQAVWDEARGCHCLRLPLSQFSAERRAIVERMGRFDRVAFDVECAEAPPSELDMILVDYQLNGELAEQTLLRLLSHLNALAAWTPQKGRKPELELPKPCSPHAS